MGVIYMGPLIVLLAFVLHSGQQRLNVKIYHCSNIYRLIYTRYVTRLNWKKIKLTAGKQLACFSKCSLFLIHLQHISYVSAALREKSCMKIQGNRGHAHRINAVLIRTKGQRVNNNYIVPVLQIIHLEVCPTSNTDKNPIHGHLNQHTHTSAPTLNSPKRRT